MAAAIGPSRSMQGDRQTGGSPPQPMAIPESGALDGGRERGNRRRESVPFVRNPTGGERTRELSMGGTPSSFRDDQVRLLQEKLQSLEAKLDVPSSSSSSSIPTRPTAQPPLGASSPTLPANSPETAASGTDAFLSQSLASQEAKEAEQQKLRALENQLEAAQEEVKRVTARLDYLKEKHQSTKHQLKTAEQRMEGLKEDVAHLTKESRAKDEHIAALKNSASAHPPSLITSKEKKLEETIAQLRQATHAHQTQNALLASQIKDIQRERAIEIASKDEEIAHLRSQLESEHKVPSSEDQTLQAEFEALQKLYFTTLVVGIKFNLMLDGQPCNMDAASLWIKVKALDLHFTKWNTWVLARFQENDYY